MSEYLTEKELFMQQQPIVLYMIPIKLSASIQSKIHTEAACLTYRNKN